MKKRLQLFIIMLVASFGFAAAPLMPSTVFAGACKPEIQKDILPGIPPWYKNMCDASQEKVGIDRENLQEDIWHIVLNLVSAALGLAGYIAIGFVMWGGTKYVIAQGESGKIAAAKTTIQNALIGLLIAVAASAIVDFVANGIGI